MDPSEAAQLAEHCLPALRAKGVCDVQTVGSVNVQRIAGVWTGEGGIARVTLQQKDTAACSFVAKSIGSYKQCDAMSLQDHWSYYNEMSFYESDLPDRMFKAGALCPLPLHVQRKGSGSSGRKASRVSSSDSSARMQELLRRFRVRQDGEEEMDLGVICMTELKGTSWRPSSERTRDALTWLARLHALFWGSERANAAVAEGVSDQTGFWHFDNRQIEFGNMSAKSPLKLAAAAIDARLKADTMQTMCHGDPKGANIMWDQDQGILMYDFQWFGKGPPTKDLAYFFATAAMNRGSWNQGEEQELLQFYHRELCGLLEKQGDTPPTLERLSETYRLAVVDYRRWVEGGFAWGNMALLDGHTEAFFQTLTAGGQKLTCEADYHRRIFECFPP
eukprot:TRINITY_DN33689_c0_g1_i1.p1 TRINITY_DN33689_c0_g1~~TRINITY_DN33689_c0_g1_i1.p1  ORF type:complete len:402 (+),score=66.19 TRINITY_DN33689_c0_g1_i1:39-1208(+)